MNGYLPKQAVQQTQAILGSEVLRERMVAHNFEIARRHYSYEVLCRHLRPILVELDERFRTAHGFRPFTASQYCRPAKAQLLRHPVSNKFLPHPIPSKGCLLKYIACKIFYALAVGINPIIVYSIFFNSSVRRCKTSASSVESQRGIKFYILRSCHFKPKGVSA